MDVSVRATAEKVGSILLLGTIIALISTDVETVIALSGFCVVGYGGYRIIISRDWISSRYSSLNRQQRVGVGATVVLILSVTVGVFGSPTDTLWVLAALLFTYVGYRGQGVIQGSIYGLGVGVTTGVLVIGLILLVFGAAVLADVPGAREILIYQVLFAPAVVGFFGGIYAVVFLIFLAVFGFFCGSVGGAISRWV